MSQNHESSRATGVVATYVVILVVCGLSWFFMIFGAMSMAIGGVGGGLHGLLTIFFIINAVTILAIVLLPLAIPGGNRQRRAVYSALLGGLILFGLPIGLGLGKAYQARSAHVNDKTLREFSWPERIAYYSSRSETECGDICLELLYGGHVREFAVYRITAHLFEQLKRKAVKNTPKFAPARPGKVFFIEHRADCPDPRKIGAAGNGVRTVIQHAALGRCLAAKPVKKDTEEPLQIVVENQHSSVAAASERFSRFFRISLVRGGTGANMRPVSDEIFARRSVVGYTVLDYPFLGPNFRFVNSGGARFLGTQSERYDHHPSPLVQFRAMAPRFQVATANDADEYQLRKSLTALSIQPPSTELIVVQATNHLKDYSAGATPLSAPKATSIIETRNRLYKLNKETNFAKANANMTADFNRSLLKAATTDLKVRLRQPEMEFDNLNLASTAFGQFYSRRTTGFYYHHRDTAKGHEAEVKAYEDAVLQFVEAFARDRKSESDRLTRSASRIVTIAGEIAAMRKSLKQETVQSLWSLAMNKKYRMPLNSFLRKHGERIDGAAQYVTARLLTSDILSNTEQTKLIRMLISMPNQSIKDDGDAVLQVVRHHVTDRKLSAVWAKPLIARLGDIGEKANRDLEAFALHSNNEIVTGAFVGLCKTGRPISDATYNAVKTWLAKMKGSTLGYRNNDLIEAAMRMIVRTGRRDQFRTEFSTDGLSPSAVRMIHPWANSSVKLEAYRCRIKPHQSF